MGERLKTLRSHLGPPFDNSVDLERGKYCNPYLSLHYDRAMYCVSIGSVSFGVS